jgi:hypothetical protein
MELAAGLVTGLGGVIIGHLDAWGDWIKAWNPLLVPDTPDGTVGV